MAHRTIKGVIQYTSKKPERMDQERGREFFTLTTQADGVQVLHAHCEIDDAPNVIRDVVLSMNPDASPIDCHVRLSVGDRYEGSGWMRFGKDSVECETHNQRDGRITQRIETPNPIRWLQAHPIVGDGLLMKLYDIAKGPGKTFFDDLMLTSPDHRGATGPLLFKTGFGIRYVGIEEVTVKAGTFKARHFQVVDTAGNLPEEHPPYDVWLTADEDYLLLKAGVGGYMQTHYELIDYQIIEGGLL
ncbi:hypothetical protein [Paraferrimonas sedimenticola]|uniref:DUF3108 domain-containing protein n=1 Tax=Paraferrimonas sedimenticola TaxID=375674 RepID=A0AA37RX25_9GAMM|nr:hypothetical protein [Paraferrimonas sedimenticola]GLP96262.1 hypothetical protein GCM10007895_15680 [Paraferrimonas sedimenticola]